MIQRSTSNLVSGDGTVDMSDHEPEAGDAVEVRSRFDQRWSRGFVVAERDGDRVLVRRRSDGAVLPAWFALSDIRPARAA